MIIANIEDGIRSLNTEINSQLSAEMYSTAESLEDVESIEHSFHRQAREWADLMSVSKIQKAITWIK